MALLEELFHLEEEDQPEPEYPIVFWNDVEVRLLNKHHSLWGERLAECGKICAKIISEKLYGVDVTDKTVLELGAGSGLPSMIACKMKAKNVVCTDYPDEDLVDNIRYNLNKYQNSRVLGYKWGETVEPLISANNGEKFDIVILSDVIFNDNQHKQLLWSISQVMKIDGYALVLHTHHRTNKVKNDLQFFDLAEKFPFNVIEVDKVKHPPMFINDTSNSEEEMELRTTAHIHKLTFVK